MPAGGGDPKVIGDGQIVKIRPEFSRGNTDIWDTRDVIVALMEENAELRAALVAAAIPGFVVPTPKLEILSA